MIDEPTDEECKARAMLLGPHFQYARRVRVFGKKVIRDAVGRQYLDPVTLEVVAPIGVGTNNFHILEEPTND